MELKLRLHAPGKRLRLISIGITLAVKRGSGKADPFPGVGMGAVEKGHIFPQGAKKGRRFNPTPDFVVGLILPN